MYRAINWNEEWKRDQASRRPPDDSEYWNKRATSFAKKAGTSAYARRFMELTGARPGETIFDMGCGSGTLALPYAMAGHEVWAADFSAAMLNIMMDKAVANKCARSITPLELAWGDDWPREKVPSCDIAIASRSIATDDLEDALVKLASRARRRVCLTLGTTESPRYDEILTKAIGRPRLNRPDFVYAMNILWDLGVNATLDYIESRRDDEFETPEDAIEKYALIYNTNPTERRRLERYIDKHLQQREDGKWSFDHERFTRWAFISWNM